MESDCKPLAVALELCCVECGRVWRAADSERWRAYLDDEDVIVFYCRSCSEREFGG